ncbi:MAG: phosphoribosylamine--glycine ligase [Methanomassiliicoccus sp.]|nr:phosphoribosylamine--glycine ligase [Methanomassiliicoccus sp.]
MKVLVVGGGGREHAIASALAASGSTIYSAMKNHNPGIARLAKESKLVKETDVPVVVDFALSKGVEMAVIGPEAPLEVGLVDSLEAKGIRCVGPSKAAARLEISKSFTRALMRRHQVPGNIDFAVFDDLASARKFVLENDREMVVKPVGLTGGKGVKVMGEHLLSKQDTIRYLEEIFEHRIGGGGVVLEEKLVGEEFTLQVFCDGHDVIPMPLVQDHKRAYEGDVGPNTGGMGAYSQEDHLLPFVTARERESALDIMRCTVAAMRAEGCEYRGILYGQFMNTRDGPRVIEYNARFGDPEAMNVLSIIASSFTDICTGIADGHLPANRVSFLRKATVCKYVVPRGYGTDPAAGKVVNVDEKAIAKIGAKAYYAMVSEENGQVLTTTSRAVGVVGIDDTIEAAERTCEKALAHVTGDALFVRHDIGRPEVVRKRVEHMQQVRR